MALPRSLGMFILFFGLILMIYSQIERRLPVWRGLLGRGAVLKALIQRSSMTRTPRERETEQSTKTKKILTRRSALDVKVKI